MLRNQHELDQQRTVKRIPFAYFRPLDQTEQLELIAGVYPRLKQLGGVSVRGAGLEQPMACSVITTRETGRIKPIQRLDVNEVANGLWRSVDSLRSARRNIPVKSVETLKDHEGQRVALMLDDQDLRDKRQEVLEQLAEVSRNPLKRLQKRLRRETNPHVTVVNLAQSASKDDWKQAWLAVDEYAPETVSLHQAKLYRVEP